MKHAVGRWPHWLAALTLGAVVAGCSSPPPPPPPEIAGPPPKPVPIDGNYDGIMQLTRGSNISCGTQDPIRLQVVNHSFHYVLNQPQVVWQTTRSFDVAIAPDGTFRAQSGTAYLRGRVGDGHMQGEIAGDACGYAFEADSTGTW